MSWDFYETSTQTAKKDYTCNGTSNFFESGLSFSDYGLSLSEAKILVKAKNDGYKIKKGTQYFECKGFYDEEWRVFRCRCDVEEVLNNCDFYRDWD